MSQNHNVIISLKSLTAKNIDSLRECVKEMRSLINIQAASSIYRAYALAHQTHDNKVRAQQKVYEGFSIAFYASTSMPAIELSEALKLLGQKRSTKSYTIVIDILLYDQQILTMPICALPKPDFHLIPAEMVPAAELRPNDRHPVLNKSLVVLAQEYKIEGWGEFFTRPETALDFLFHST